MAKMLPPDKNDIHAQLDYYFHDDSLYVLLNKKDRIDSILNPEMIAQINIEEDYSPLEVSRMTGVNDSTIRHWINELELYINPQKDRRNNRLDFEAIIKIRMIQLHRDRGWTLTKIKRIVYNSLGVLGMLGEEDNDSNELQVQQSSQNTELFEFIKGQFEKLPHILAAIEQQGNEIDNIKRQINLISESNKNVDDLKEKLSIIEENSKQGQAELKELVTSLQSQQKTELDKRITREDIENRDRQLLEQIRHKQQLNVNKRLIQSYKNSRFLRFLSGLSKEDIKQLEQELENED